MECSICGISYKNRLIFPAVSPTGIVIVCEKCAAEEGFPRVKKPQPVIDNTKGESVYKRMTRISGVTPSHPEPSHIRVQEKSIKEIVNKNYEEKLKRESLRMKPRPDLTENFHWILMRVRRVKGLTQKQLAERIGESEDTIKMAEQGVVPEGYKLIDKLEQFFKVRLIKERESMISQNPKSLEVMNQPSHTHFVQSPPQQQLSQSVQQSKQSYIPQQPQIHPQSRLAQQQQQMPKPALALKFDKDALNSLTIADLQRMKLEKEARKREMQLSDEEESEEKMKSEQEKNN